MANFNIIYLNVMPLFCFLIYIIQTHIALGVEEDQFCSRINSTLKNKSFLCTNVRTSFQVISSLPNDVEELEIQNSSIIIDNTGTENSLKKFQNLQYVTIINSQFAALENWLHSLPNLTTLNIVRSSVSYLINHVDSNITVIDIEVGAFKSLQWLNISDCNISDITIDSQNTSPALNLSNNRFECGNNFTWLLNAYETQKNPIELNNTICFMKLVNDGPNPILYSLRNKPLLLVLDFKREATVNCPPKCVCNFKGLITRKRPIMNVDCIGLNMTELPNVIPKGTSRCNFSYNLIEDLTPLYSNKLYDSVGMIALSHNLISYLDPVKLPAILKSRRDVGYCLDHNRITKFPAEAVKKVYDEDFKLKNNRFKAFFVLSGNPWSCSCDYIWHFQDFIYRHSYDMLNERDIRCADDDPVSPGESILTLDVSTICSDEPLLETLDIVNLCLSIVLILLIVDFAYNYRQYRKHRKLPWIITRFQ